VKGLPEDILDHKTYGKLGMPVLALGGPGYGWLKAVLEPTVGKLKLVKMEGSGHFIAEEKPADTIAAIEAFLD
jgi:pimeloyl-ACP methyl ester carboxylesterase